MTTYRQRHLAGIHANPDEKKTKTKTEEKTTTQTTATKTEDKK